jgi:hypothetical protein
MSSLYTIWNESGFLAAFDAVLRSMSIDWIPLLLAAMTPIMIIYCRNESRLRRLKKFQDFAESYPTTEFADGRPGQRDRDPSLEFVKSKYLSDARIPADKWEQFTQANLGAQIQMILRTSRSIGNPGDIQMLVASIGFVIVSYYGFVALKDALATGLITVPPSAATTACSPDILFRQVTVIGALAFAGAYIAAVRIFLRALAVFDLSAYTFLRQAVEMLASVLLIVFAFKAFPNPLQDAAAAVNLASAPGCAEIPWYWLALAPVFALLPESSTNFLLTRMRSFINWVKRDDDRYVNATRIVPLDVIEGIDYLTRFRLEECGIVDVQNLATYNPIMLFVESPYGIYQTVDWVGQAQLCHIVGLDRFLVLREMNVRTIFDLERAIDFKIVHPDSAISKESPDEFDEIFAGILFSVTDTMRDVCRIGHISPFRMINATPTPGTVEEYSVWVVDRLKNGPSGIKRCVEHTMSWIADDVHVRRLRRIWQELTDNLGERSARLDNPAQLTVKPDIKAEMPANANEQPVTNEEAAIAPEGGQPVVPDGGDEKAAS